MASSEKEIIIILKQRWRSGSIFQFHKGRKVWGLRRRSVWNPNPGRANLETCKMRVSPSAPVLLEEKVLAVPYCLSVAPSSTRKCLRCRLCTSACSYFDAVGPNCCKSLSLCVLIRFCKGKLGIEELWYPYRRNKWYTDAVKFKEINQLICSGQHK